MEILEKSVVVFVTAIIAVFLLVVLIDTSAQRTNELFPQDALFVSDLVLNKTGVATTLSNTPTVMNDITAKNNTWLDFNTSSYVDVGDFAVHEPENITLLAWVKPSTISGTYHIINKRKLNNGYILYQSGSAMVFLAGDGSKSNFTDSSGKLTAGVWDFIGGTFDTDGGNGLMKVYDNGVAVGTSKTLQSGINYTTEILSIGREEQDNGDHFNGSIDEVRVYNRTLLPALMRRLKNESVHGENLGQGIVSLYMHQIKDGCTAGTQYCVGNFTKLLSWLSNNSYETITYDNLYDWKMNNNFTMPERPIILTFDDGHRSVCENASTYMTQYGFVGVFPIISSYPTDQASSSCSWSQIESLHDAGWQITSHSLNHSHLLALNVSTRAEQFNTSRWEIYNNISVMPSMFTYPYNEHNVTTDNECSSYYKMCSGGSQDLYDDNGFIYERMNMTHKNEYGLTRYQITNADLLRNITDTIDIYSGLVLKYNFNENSGNKTYDLSTESKNGTNIGGAWKNDVDVSLTANQYVRSGTTFILNDSMLSYSEINVSYTSGENTEPYGFHLSLMQIVTGFITLILLVFVYALIQQFFERG